MRSDDIVISVRNITKSYRLFNHPGDRIKQFLSFGLKRYHREFNALSDVSFDIRRGETIGIIGRNGSGKSTLLQCICGILKPTAGAVRVNGRISALLELGSGFNPEFTGRENVYFQGTLMGFTKMQMDEKFDDIAAFADIGEFLDQPVRMYSSGMFVRLAFAVAVGVDPDILVVDEALAVGDGSFQEKCLSHIDGIRKRGGTILIVTHSLEQVAHHCDRALLLESGHLLADGNTAKTLALYLGRLKDGLGNGLREEAISSQDAAHSDEPFSRHPAYNAKETRWGDGQASITDICITQNGRDNPKVLTPGIPIQIKLSVLFHVDIERPIYGLTIKSNDGAILFSKNSKQLLGSLSVPSQIAGEQVCASFSLIPFLDSGKYSLSLGVVGESTEGIVPHDRRYDSILLSVANPRSGSGDLDMKPMFGFVDEL